MTTHTKTIQVGPDAVNLVQWSTHPTGLRSYGRDRYGNLYTETREPWRRIEADDRETIARARRVLDGVPDELIDLMRDDER